MKDDKNQVFKKQTKLIHSVYCTQLTDAIVLLWKKIGSKM